MNKWDRIHQREGQIQDGYVLLPRAIDDSPIFGLPPCTRELFLYILRKVNHAPYEGLKRGQGHFTYSTIINDLSWRSGYRKEHYTKKQIADGIRRLKNASMVETMKVTRGIVVTACNYDFYQDPSNYGGNNGGNKNGLRRSHGGVHDIQERKNDYNKVTAQFEIFWNQYHQITGLPKTDRKRSLKCFEKLSKEEQAKAIENIEPYYNSLSDKKYCQKARTYLTAESFNDQFADASQSQILTINEPEYND